MANFVKERNEKSIFEDKSDLLCCFESVNNTRKTVMEHHCKDTVGENLNKIAHIEDSSIFRCDIFNSILEYKINSSK